MTILKNCITHGNQSVIFRQSERRSSIDVPSRIETALISNFSSKQPQILVSNSQRFLNELIKKTGCSITQLAAEIGISQSALYRIFSGETKKPRNSVFRRLLNVYCRMQQMHLETCYREASQELNDVFETAISDGLEEDETW